MPHGLNITIYKELVEIPSNEEQFEEYLLFWVLIFLQRVNF